MPTELENHVEEGIRLLCEVNDAARAVDEFSRALAMDPGCLVAFIYRHFAYVELKMWQSALSDLNQSIRLSPEDHRIYSYRADVNLELHDYAATYADLCNALELDGYENELPPPSGEPDDDDFDASAPEAFDASAPAEFDASVPTAMFAPSAGITPEMLADLAAERAEQSERWFVLLWKRGYTLLKLRRFGECIEDYTQVLNVNPDACAYNNRSYAHRRLGHLEEALADATKSVELNGDHPDHHNCRAEAYDLLGRTDEARLDREAALDACDRAFDPLLTDDIVLTDRAEALLGLARYEESIELSRKVIESGPSDSDPYRVLATALAQVGKLDEALTYFDKAIEIDLDPDLLNKRADLLDKLGEPERANKDRDLAKRNPVC